MVLESSIADASSLKAIIVKRNRTYNSEPLHESFLSLKLVFLHSSVFLLYTSRDDTELSLLLGDQRTGEHWHCSDLVLMECEEAT